MGIKTNTRVFNVINAIMKSTIFTRSEMRELDIVISYLITVKEDETAKWIEEHKIEFLRGLLEGFEIDNSQNAQLKDIHTQKYL